MKVPSQMRIAPICTRDSRSETLIWFDALPPSSVRGFLTAQKRALILYSSSHTTLTLTILRSKLNVGACAVSGKWTDGAGARVARQKD